MIEIVRATIEDKEFIDMAWNDPDVNPFINDDFTSGMTVDLTPFLKNENLYFLLPIFHGDKIGFFVLTPWNSICYEVHTVILPRFRGRLSIEACRQGLLWMFTNTRCMKIVTHVPSYNRLAYALAMKVGGEMDGINKASFLRNGKLYDQYLFGYRKEAVLCQQHLS